VQDLNDLYYFAEVVTHGGFSPASRATGEPKSKLSRKVAALEAQLGVRLIERSTRRFKVTAVGERFFEHCRSMMIEVEAGKAEAAESRDGVTGVVRFSCPPAMLQTISPILPAFLVEYPDVRLHILSVNAPVELIDQKVDLALRVRTSPDQEMSLTTRTLASNLRILVGSPSMKALIPDGANPSILSSMSTVSFIDQIESWTLTRPRHDPITVILVPRVICGDIFTLRDAAVGGVGIALLPDHSCRRELADGSLVRILPEWSGPTGSINLVFTGSRGQPPAVRAFIDHLAKAFSNDLLLHDHATLMGTPSSS
jgi:DNA-binding transcriptional LysR family regulator